MKRYNCHVISEGEKSKHTGEVMISPEAFCFYLVDPNNGVIIEKNHSLEGQSIAGKILIFPNGKASSVVQADGMYQLKMKGNAPLAMITQNADTTLVASSIILNMAMVHRVDSEFYKVVKSGDIVEIDTSSGTISIVDSKPADSV